MQLLANHWCSMVEGTVCVSIQVVLVGVRLLARNDQFPPLPLHTKMCICVSHIPIPSSKSVIASLVPASLVAIHAHLVCCMAFVFFTIFAFLQLNFSIKAI